MRHLGCAAFMLAAALAGCDAPRPPNPGLWTLFDVQALYAGGAPSSHAIALDAGLPGGVPIGTMLESDQKTLFVAPSWAEGYPAAYVTTEVWTHFDAVWAQPMYVPITGWDGTVPKRVVDAYGAWHPIFSVGAASLFYSPFWQMIHVLVPEGTEWDDVTSTRQILDGKYAQFPVGGWVAALSPSDVELDSMPSMPSGGAVPGQGWLDGNPISFVKFPAAPFTVDANQVVDEVPIFHFVFAKSDGALVAPAIPSVLGTGPLYSRTPAPIDDNGIPTAAYSAYWRVYTVVVPPTARVFAPPGSDAEAALTMADVSNDVPPYGGDILNPVDADALKAVNDVKGRIALAPGCFASAGTSTGQNNSCIYLDSQEKIETNLPGSAIVRTDITVTCPLVSVNGAAVMP